MDDEKKPQKREVTIQVNSMPVTMSDRRVTGLQIKEAAIAQGVPIGLDFVLSEEINANRTRIVRDDEVITITNKSVLDAVAGDDNS